MRYASRVERVVADPSEAQCKSGDGREQGVGMKTSTLLCTVYCVLNTLYTQYTRTEHSVHSVHSAYLYTVLYTAYCVLCTEPYKTTYGVTQKLSATVGARRTPCGGVPRAASPGRRSKLTTPRWFTM